MDKPTSPTDDSTPEYKAVHEKWERSNRIGLMIVKDTIPETFRGGEEINDLKQFLAEMDLRFARSDKAEISMHLHRFSTMRYHGNGNIREYILEMSNIVSKLKTLKTELPPELLIYFVLNSLPSQFSQLKSNYNTQKEQWSLNELIAYCVQEEDRINKKRLKVLIWHTPLRLRAKERKLSPLKTMLLRVLPKRNMLRVKIHVSFAGRVDT
ncbi:hypothetical protein ISN45_Aa03g028740 [Arabidopsis thaliana x Arabidopsis arenosa]|uniref:Uncharacterized protein n=1 Tax=Arabidopsis thaliana x Arabidopsis arenosa TaxID=1240361 RepID=A0A8T2AWR1_9BRAS|nr:hypothetical protein ISN45_Aa03g028740 [Arabidopsis thaliana x Arabidopsis arenosa]